MTSRISSPLLVRPCRLRTLHLTGELIWSQEGRLFHKDRVWMLKKSRISTPIWKTIWKRRQLYKGKQCDQGLVWTTSKRVYEALAWIIYLLTRQRENSKKIKLHQWITQLNLSLSVSWVKARQSLTVVLQPLKPYLVGRKLLRYWKGVVLICNQPVRTKKRTVATIL